jgi:DNA-binding LacI/PurR family transcriptional regulator
LERAQGYRDALEKFHIPFNPDFMIPCGVNMTDGDVAIEQAFAKGLDFDAVFCFTETQAFGAKRSLQEHHKSIPEEVAICCMSGTILSTMVYPQITAVEQPTEKLAEVAAKLLLAKIEDFNTPEQNIVLNATMVVRESTEIIGSN